jgi:hypothetical protein
VFEGDFQVLQGKEEAAGKNQKPAASRMNSNLRQKYLAPLVPL